VTLRILAAFWLVMSATGLATEYLFARAHLVPASRPAQIVQPSFQWNYTTYLNLIFLVVFGVLIWLFRNRERPRCRRPLCDRSRLRDAGRKGSGARDRRQRGSYDLLLLGSLSRPLRYRSQAAAGCSALSRKRGDSVALETRVARDDRQTFEPRLRDQHAVEGIIVQRRQRSRGKRMGDADCESLEPVAIKLIHKVIGCLQLAE